jgi:hypothetical protein
MSESFEVIDVASGSDDDVNVDRGDLLEDTAPESSEAAPEAKPDEAKPEEEKQSGERDAQGRFIPKARFDEVNNQRKSLKEQNEELNRRLEELERMRSNQPVLTDSEGRVFDIAAAENQYIQLVYEGNNDEALQLRMNINQALVNQMQQQMLTSQDNTVLHSVAETALDSLPDLNDNVGLQDAVVALRDRYIREERIPMAVALQRAVNFFVELRGGIPQAEPAPNLGQQRKADAVKRGVALANQQPPAMHGIGVSNRQDSGVVDAAKLSEKAFKGLSEEERARARGDIL